MQKTTYRYEQSAARLTVEGFPDLSAGQGNDSIGILSGWRLQLVAAPELEGTREHLEAMMAVVMMMHGVVMGHVVMFELVKKVTAWRKAGSWHGPPHCRW